MKFFIVTAALMLAAGTASAGNEARQAVAAKEFFAPEKAKRIKCPPKMSYPIRRPKCPPRMGRSK